MPPIKVNTRVLALTWLVRDIHTSWNGHHRQRPMASNSQEQHPARPWHKCNTTDNYFPRSHRIQRRVQQNGRNSRPITRGSMIFHPEAESLEMKSSQAADHQSGRLKKTNNSKPVPWKTTRSKSQQKMADML